MNKSIYILLEFKHKLGIQVKSVPAIFLFKDGKFLARSNEIMSKKELYGFVYKFL